VRGVALPALSAHRDAMRKAEEFRGLPEKEVETVLGLVFLES
jgi:hypothetical protein